MACATLQPMSRLSPCRTATAARPGRAPACVRRLPGASMITTMTTAAT